MAPLTPVCTCSTVRAYGVQSQFVDESNARVDLNNRVAFYL
jgi:hypothetical protein